MSKSEQLLAEKWFEAATYDDFDLIRDYVAQGFDINTRSVDQKTALMKAAWFGHRSVTQFLCAIGANLGDFDNLGNTALHFSAYGGHLDCCKILLAAGAQVNAPNNEQNTPAHIAAWFETLHVIDVLAEHQANFSLKGHKEMTVLEMIRTKYGEETLADVENKLLTNKISQHNSPNHSLSF